MADLHLESVVKAPWGSNEESKRAWGSNENKQNRSLAGNHRVCLPSHAVAYPGGAFAPPLQHTNVTTCVVERFGDLGPAREGKKRAWHLRKLSAY